MSSTFGSENFVSLLRDEAPKFVNDLIELVSSFDSYTPSLPPQFQHILRELKDFLKNTINTIKQDIQEIHKNWEWDTFNISFFGETNAGKSTLIEALIGGDGCTIGDGRKDFTQSVIEHSFTLASIPNLKIKLIDMPGIEGNETKVIEVIKSAIWKSHLICFVTSATKPPEVGTLEKVKSFLNNRAKVLVILNKRTGIESYRFTRGILTDNVKTVMESTKRLVYEKLGNFFTGKIIVIDAHLSFLSRGKIEPDNRFHDQLQRALKILPDKHQWEKLSGLSFLIKSIESRAKNAKLEIKRSNFYKFLGEVEKITSAIMKKKKELDEEIRKTLSEKNNLIEEVNRKIENTINQIEIKKNSFLRDLKTKIIKRFYESIDEKTTPSESEIERIVTTQVKGFQMAIENQLEDLRKSLEGSIHLFQRKIQLIINTSPNIRINIEIGRLLDISASKIGDYLLAFGKTFISSILSFFIGGIWGWIVGGIMAFSGFFSFLLDLDDMKSKKKRKVENLVEREMIKVERDVEHKITEIRKEIKMKVTMLNAEINKLSKSIREISKLVDEKIAALQQRRKVFINEFLRDVFGDFGIDVDFGYIDLDLRSGLIVLKSNHSYSESELKQLAEALLSLRFIYIFPSKRELLMALNNGMIPNKALEFFYRSANILREELGVEKVVKDNRNQSLKLIMGDCWYDNQR